MSLADELGRRKDKELKQTEEYVPSDGDNTSVSSEITSESEDSDIKKGLSRKSLILILGGAVVAVLCVTIVFLMGSSKNKELKEPYFMTESEQIFEYTYDELEALRLAGYTGDEIENFEGTEASAEQLIRDAEAKRMKQYEEEVAPFRDSASLEYKELEAFTWLGQEDLVFDGDKSMYTYHNMAYNSDYEKVPAKGFQLFLKVYLNNSHTKYAFMTIDPVRYNELLDSGNIVLSIDYIITADEKQIVTDIKEILT